MLLCVSSSYQSPVFSFSPVALRAFRRLVLGKRWSHQVHQAEWHHAPIRYTTQCRGRWPWNMPPVNKRDRDINQKKKYRDWHWHCLLVIKPFWLMKWCLPRFCFHLWLQDTKLRLLVKQDSIDCAWHNDFPYLVLCILLVRDKLIREKQDV